MKNTHVLIASSLALLGLCGAALVLAGPLNPPAGPVAPTFKTLADVEPRIAVSASTTPGDADSLYRITQPGSYYLTGNINGVAGRMGIEIASSGVTLDLNGFDLVGIPGSLAGVYVTMASAQNVGVMNGSVRSWGGAGVDLGFGPAINTRIHAVISTSNGGRGIRAGVSAIVTDCSANLNADDGFVIASGGVISGCAALSNAGAGITTGGGCTITGCLAKGNTEDGLRFATECSVRFNTCADNGNGAGDGAGIHASHYGNRIEDNTCSGNDRGIDVDSPNNFLVRNTCTRNTLNFVLVANNVHGPIIDRTSVASGFVTGDSAPSSLGSTDANANFSF